MPSRGGLEVLWFGLAEVILNSMEQLDDPPPLAGGGT
jgi:hypothetical protein